MYVMRVNVYHALPERQLQQILAEGLHYGKQGPHSREPFAARANTFLDKHRPTDLLNKKLSRRKCIYAFLGLNDALIDIRTGKPVAPGEWHAGHGKAKLQLQVAAANGYVADLDMYDHIAGLLATGDVMPGLSSLAYTYWHGVLPLGHVVEHYTASVSGGIIAKASAPIHLPRALGRVEVLLTEDVPPESIAVLGLQN